MPPTCLPSSESPLRDARWPAPRQNGALGWLRVVVTGASGSSNRSLSDAFGKPLRRSTSWVTAMGQSLMSRRDLFSPGTANTCTVPSVKCLGATRFAARDLSHCAATRPRVKVSATRGCPGDAFRGRAAHMASIDVDAYAVGVAIGVCMGDATASRRS